MAVDDSWDLQLWFVCCDGYRVFQAGADAVHAKVVASSGSLLDVECRARLLLE